MLNNMLNTKLGNEYVLNTLLQIWYLLTNTNNIICCNKYSNNTFHIRKYEKSRRNSTEEMAITYYDDNIIILSNYQGQNDYNYP